MPAAGKPRIVPRVPKPSQLTFEGKSVEAFLVAFGDDDRPLPETVKVLDEIVTDYIIESCHEAASVAHHARRAKIKLDDFKFMLRRDTSKLGRVSEMLDRDKDLKRQRKAFDTDEGTVAKDTEKENDGGEAGDKGAKSVGVSGAKSDAGKGGDEERKKKKRKKNKDDASTASNDSRDPAPPKVDTAVKLADTPARTAETPVMDFDTEWRKHCSSVPIPGGVHFVFDKDGTIWRERLEEYWATDSEDEAGEEGHAEEDDGLGSLFGDDEDQEMAD